MFSLLVYICCVNQTWLNGSHGNPINSNPALTSGNVSLKNQARAIISEAAANELSSLGSVCLRGHKNEGQLTKNLLHFTKDFRAEEQN